MAKKLYKSERAFMQAAITDVLIGVLLLSYVLLNEHSYLLTMKHLDQALLYFAKENPSAPILYRAWLKSSEMQKIVTPDGISVLDPELHFGELSDVLWTLTV